MSDTHEPAGRLPQALRELYCAKVPHHGGGAVGQMMGCESYRLVATGFAFNDLLEAAEYIDRLRAELAQAQDKALRFDLDAAGIARRDAEAVELVSLRAEVLALQERAAFAESKEVCGKAHADYVLEFCQACKIERLYEVISDFDKRLSAQLDEGSRRADEIDRLRALFDTHIRANIQLTDTIDRLRAELAQAREWIEKTPCHATCDSFIPSEEHGRIWYCDHPCTCGRDALLRALEPPTT